MEIFKDTVNEFLKDDCPRMAAALSYYTVFSLPGLLLLMLLVAGVFADPADLQGRLLSQIRALVGEGGVEQVRAILRNLNRPGGGHPLAAGGSIAVLLFAATGAFAQLQGALNRAWEVEPDPERGGMVRNFLMKRILSFLLILGAALLLLVSLLAQTVLTAFGDFVQALLPPAFSAVALRGLSIGLSLFAAILLFGALFHILPDARVHWRDAWRGAAATGLLFLVGNTLFGFYLSTSSPGSAYGAAGSLALLLVWIYYSSMIFFFGAELTQVLARRRGEGIRPSRGAVRVVLERRIVRDAGQDARQDAGRDAGDGTGR
ncbi:MAG: YihY/virulence factor BrkB family protein [Gemmatimonadota bacterium]